MSSPPSSLYQACGILGATVMPHSLYLGSGIVQPRLREFDDAHSSSNTLDTASLSSSEDPIKYKPSLAAIQSCMSYSIVELAISLFTFALFVNSAILIVAGASLYSHPEAADADLFSIHALLASSIAPVAGTLFALALLLSGTSAGIVCTIAGQMVSEGQLNWSIKPWVRRLITRSISITPSIIIAGAVGREGLGKALQGSQVALSVILPFVSAPLIWFTCRGAYMKVAVVRDGSGAGAGGNVDGDGHGEGEAQFVQMRNHWVTAGFALVIWGVIVVMNVALLVLVGMGVA
jgi:metal iron transporter